MRVRKEPRGEEGASLVEFALVLPIFAALLFGLIDFGLIFGGFITLRSGTNAGARAASLSSYASGCGSTPTADAILCTIESRIGNSLPGVVPSSIQVAIIVPASYAGDPNGGVGGTVEVCAKAQIQSITGFFTTVVQARQMHANSLIRIDQPITYGNGLTATTAPDGSAIATASDVGDVALQSKGTNAQSAGYLCS